MDCHAVMTKAVLTIEMGRTEIIRTEGWEKAVKKQVLPWECLTSADRWLWRKMGRKRAFRTERTIL